jgi:hypothetical protein
MSPQAVDEELIPMKGRRRTFSALRNPNYRYFYAGQSLSLIGTWSRTAALVDFQIHSPYVMFVLYMAPKDQRKEIVVGRDTIAMVYKGQEYKMPSLKELRDDYQGEIHDIDFYRHLGKEGTDSSWIRFYNFARGVDFFPALGKRLPARGARRRRGIHVRLHGVPHQGLFQEPRVQEGRPGDVPNLGQERPQAHRRGQRRHRLAAATSSGKIRSCPGPGRGRPLPEKTVMAASRRPS